MAGTIASTKGTQAAGLVASTGPRTVNSVAISNYSGSSAYAVISDKPSAATDFTKIVGSPKLIPAGAEVILGNDFFGPAGMGFNTGVTIDMSTTSTSFATAGAHFDIDVTAP